MDKQTYEQEVLRRLPAIEPDELQFVQRAIVDCFEKSFLVSEAAENLRYLEHVNPDLEESIALAAMKRVNERVLKRLNAKE